MLLWRHLYLAQRGKEFPRNKKYMKKIAFHLLFDNNDNFFINLNLTRVDNIGIRLQERLVEYLNHCLQKEYIVDYNKN